MKQKQRKTLLCRRRMSILLALSVLLSVLAGCSGQTSAETEAKPQSEETAGASVSAETETETMIETEPETEATTEAVLPEPDPLEKALEQYRIIVSQAEAYDYGSVDEPTGVYRYALVQMRTRDDIPALLLEQMNRAEVANICVFQYEADSETVFQAVGALQEGIRGSLSAAGDGNGLLSTEFSGGTGKGSTSRLTLDGDRIQYETLWEGNIFDGTDWTGEEIGLLEIDWHDCGDTSALGGEAPPAEMPALTDGDRIVFTGTLGLYSHNDVLSLQGISDPNPGSDFGETYWIVVLDKPQNMTLLSGSGMGNYENMVSMINIIDADSLEQYNGQHLTLSIDAENSWWPSDTSLPLGQPNTRDIRILE